jgi:riboflavin kinase / FMN adenylyltransferase
VRHGEAVVPGSCITIGNFDGVHLAHQLIISELRAAARQSSRASGLVTFEPAPQSFLHNEFPFILTPFPEKQERVAALGLDFMYVIPFDEDLRRRPAESFLREFIIEPLHPSLIVVGSDHRFGSDRRGDTALLARFRDAARFELRVIPEIEHDGAPVKSTRIRERLVLGAVRDAAELLGYRYAIRGRVVRGRNVGTGLGFPTINIQPDSPEKLIPPAGVYAVTVQIGEQRMAGAMNIGFRPTFAGPDSRNTGGDDGVRGSSLEVHLLDFSGQLYGETVSVEFVERLRTERRFESTDDLKAQITADVARARTILAESKWQKAKTEVRRFGSL